MLPGELRLGSEAQLRGELSQDFTSHCRESLIASLTDAVSKLEVHRNDVPLVYELEEDVSCLLVSVDPEVLLLALEAHAVASRSCAFSSITDIYLKDFSYGWPGDNEPLDLMTCIHGCATPEATRLASSLYFEFYQGGKLRVIQMGMEELQSQDCLLLYNRLVQDPEFQVPEHLRFALLTRIRFAKAFPCMADRHQYVEIMLRSLSAAGCRYPQKQVREVATNRDIPDSLRVAAVYASNRDPDLFATQERDAMIHSFLAGDAGCCSFEFIKALFYHAPTPLVRLQAQDRKHRRKLPLTANVFALLSLADVLAWLEDELDEEKSTVSHFEEHANLGQRQRTIRGLIMSRRFHDVDDEMTTEQSSLRSQCLEKILDDSNLLERSSDSDGAVHLSLDGWKIVESCMEHFSTAMRPGACSKMVGLILSGMPGIPKSLLKAAMGNDNGLVAIYLLQAGGYKFLEQLPSSTIGFWLWIKDPVDDSAFESMAKSAEQLGRCASSSKEHFEKLVKFMGWMLGCNNVHQVHTGSLTALVTTGAVKRLLEAVRKRVETSAASESLKECFGVMEIFVKHRWKWERVLEQTDVSRMLCLILGTVLYVLKHCNEEQLGRVETHAATIICRLCPAAADTGTEQMAEIPESEIADMASSTIKVATGNSDAATVSPPPLPPLPEMIDFRLKLVKFHELEYGVDLVIWRRYERSERERGFMTLLDHAESEDPSLAAAAATFVNSVVVSDYAAANAVRDKVVASRLLELAFSKGFADKLVSAVAELFLPYDEDGMFNPFTRHERSEEETKKALAWFVSYVPVVDSSDDNVPELLSLGCVLTENHKLTMELVASSDFRSLFQSLLELYRDLWSSGRSRTTFINTVWHFLEDCDMLYNRMVKDMRDFLVARDGENQGSSPCEVGEFLKQLSDLAQREPAVFMQASSDTCQVIDRASDSRQYIVLRDRDGHHNGGSVITRHFRDVFSVMLDILLPDLQLADIELLTEICDWHHEAVELVLGHQPAVLHGFLRSDYGSYEVQRFLDVVERHNKAFVDEMRARAYLGRDAHELFRCCSYLGVPDASDADRKVKSLCGLDLDHPSAHNVVVNFVADLERFSTGKKCLQETSEFPPETQGDLKEVSQEGIKTFCIQQNLRAHTSVVSAASMIESEQEAATPMIPENTTLDNGNGTIAGQTIEESASSQEEDEMEPASEGETESEEDEEPCVANRLWMFDNVNLEKIVRLLWLSPLCPASLCSLLENHVDHTRLAMVLVGMVLRPGELRAFGSEGNGHWHRNPVAGVPPFVAERVVGILHGLSSRHGFSLLACINEDDAISFTSVMLRNTVSVEKLLRIVRGLSGNSIVKLCSLSADTESAGNFLASFIAENPALSPAVTSTVVSISGQLICTTLEKLRAGDHTSDNALLHFLRNFDRVVAEDDTAARQQLRLSLDPLWIHAAHDHPSARLLLQALFLAQTFSSEPADSAVKLANDLLCKNMGRNLDLILPLLWKWPTLFAVEMDVRLKHLRKRLVRTYRSLGLRVDRGDILMDSYKQFAKHSVEGLRQFAVSVKFKGERVVGGGVKREWFQLLSKALKNKDALLFSAVGDCYQPNPLSGARPDHLSYFKFVGRVVARAIIDDVKLDIRFTPWFLKHILGIQVSYRDMEPQVSKNLTWLLQNEVDESMGLTFSVDKISSDASKDQVFDLVPGGRGIFVTERNKHEYVDRVAKYHLTDCIKPQMDAFLEGFFQLVPKDAIRIFSELELAFLISGNEEIDVAELKTKAETDGDCDVLQWFWDIVEGFDKENRARLLRFITGSAKIEHLQIGVFVSDKVEDINLPTACTCFNSIDLPRYKSRDQLEQKLLFAIREGCEGFHFEEG